MKKILFFCLSIIHFNVTQSQNIIEKREIYSSPGINNKLTTYLGVTAMGGNRFDDSYSAVVEVIDLKENGFIIRDKLKIIYFDNHLQKISENELTEFYDKSKGLIEFYTVTEGVWIVQNKINTKGFKLAFINKKGLLTVKSMAFQEKYEDASAFFDYPNNKLQIVAFFTERGKDKSHTYRFTSSDLSFVKSVNSDEPENSLEKNDGFVYIYKSYTSTSYRNYLLSLVVLEGKVKVEVTERLETGNKLIRSFEVAVPVKAIDAKILQNLREEPNLYVNEENDDIYIFYNIQDNNFHGFLSIKSPSSGLPSAQLINETTMLPYKLEKKNFTLFTLNLKLCPSDAAIYWGHYYPVLNFHSRAYITSSVTIAARETGGSTQNINNTIQLTIGEKGKIIKSETFHFSKPPVNHKDLIMIPKERAILFKSEDYKPQEMDLIYESEARLNPEENIFSILKRKDYSFIINFKEKDSAVDVWKVKF